NWSEYTDGLGAITKTLSPNERNQYSKINSSVANMYYTWLGGIWKDGDRDRKYEWDAFGRLTKVYQGTNPGALVATYRYDALNRRVEKTVAGAYAAGDEITRFSYDGWRAIEERGITGPATNQTEVVRAR